MEQEFNIASIMLEGPSTLIKSVVDALTEDAVSRLLSLASRSNVDFITEQIGVIKITAIFKRKG